MLDDLLSRWAHWCRPVGLGRGFNGTAVVVGQFQISRQYDDANGALDSDTSSRIMDDFSEAVFKLIPPYSYAIQMQARNLATGHWVWRHPRLPPPGDELKEIVTVARRQLFRLYPL